MRLSALRSPAVLLLCAWFPGVDVASAAEESPNRHSVKAVGAVQADVDRAVFVLHGRLRDADVYWRAAQQAAQAAAEASRHTLLIVPQFLAERDVLAHALPPDTCAGA